MLWLALYFPQLPLEVLVRGGQQGGALAVVEAVGGRDQIIRCNATARACGVYPGLALPAALALCAGLAVRRREPERERRALDELAAWAYQFSARISFEPSLLLLELGASQRLFGGLETLMRAIQCELGKLGYHACHALSPTPTASGLLARSRPGCEVTTVDALRAAVASLPLGKLTRERRARALIEHIGLETIGDVLALPRAELARRAGPGLTALLDRLLGDAPDPRVEWSPPARFSQRIELFAEIVQVAALVFPARRLMVALCGFLRGLGGGAQRLHWTLQHRDCDATHFSQGLLDPSRDPDYMLEVFRERIERLELPAPVIALTLRVDDWQAYSERNLSLLDDTTTQRQSDQLLLTRLANRLGEHRVRGLRCFADHRPERAWRLCRPGETSDTVVPGSVDQGRSQPPWLLPQPRPLHVRNDVPEYGGALRLEGLPERIESGWWDGSDITRDYFIAQSPAGERLWIFRDRRGGGWYLHGLFV